MARTADHHHGHHRDRSVTCAVLTVSDTRTPATDESGRIIRRLLEESGHAVASHQIVPDDVEQVRLAVTGLAGGGGVEAVLVNGGTGIAPRDGTFEAVSALLDRQLDGFGEIFRHLSYEEIGPAAMMSRAVAGLIGSTVLFSMPGSPKAVALAMEKLILPELGHLVGEARKGAG